MRQEDMRDDRSVEAAGELLALETEEIVLPQKNKRCSPRAAAL